MMGSKGVRPDQYSKLIDLVSSPETLTKRLEELKLATTQHEEAYQRAMLAKEQVEDANKGLNERADLISRDYLEREKTITAKEAHLNERFATLETQEKALSKRELEFSSFMREKEAGLAEGIAAFNKWEAEQISLLEEATRQNNTEHQENSKKLEAQLKDLEHKQTAFEYRENDLNRFETKLLVRERELSAFVETLKTEYAKTFP